MNFYLDWSKLKRRIILSPNNNSVLPYFQRVYQMSISFVMIELNSSDTENTSAQQQNRLPVIEIEELV